MTKEKWKEAEQRQKVKGNIHQGSEQTRRLKQQRKSNEKLSRQIKIPEFYLSKDATDPFFSLTVVKMLTAPCQLSYILILRSKARK